MKKTSELKPKSAFVVLVILPLVAAGIMVFAIVSAFVSEPGISGIEEERRKAEQKSSTEQMKEHIERLKVEKALWDEQNPGLAVPRSYLPSDSQSTNDGYSSRVPSQRRRTTDICGAPDSVRSAGGAHVYRYKSGPCEGIYGFDENDSLVIAGEQ